MYSVAILVRHDTMGPFGEDASLIDAIVEENDGSYTIVPYKAKWFNELQVKKPRTEMHSPVDVAKQMGLVLKEWDCQYIFYCVLCGKNGNGTWWQGGGHDTAAHQEREEKWNFQCANVDRFWQEPHADKWYAPRLFRYLFKDPHPAGFALTLDHQIELYQPREQHQVYQPCPPPIENAPLLRDDNSAVRDLMLMVMRQTKAIEDLKNEIQVLRTEQNDVRRKMDEVKTQFTQCDITRAIEELRTDINGLRGALQQMKDVVSTQNVSGNVEVNATQNRMAASWSTTGTCGQISTGSNGNWSNGAPWNARENPSRGDDWRCWNTRENTSRDDDWRSWNARETPSRDDDRRSWYARENPSSSSSSSGWWQS